MWFVPNTVGGSGSGPILGKLCKISSHLTLEPVFAGLKLTKNCYINMNISFSGKEEILLKTGFSSLSYKHTVPKRLFYQFHEQIMNKFFIELRKIGNTKSAYIKKTTFLKTFSSMRKNWEAPLGQNSYIQNLFVNQGKT